MKRNKKKHITKEERFTIEKMVKRGYSYQNIADVLARGKSSICEEVNKNGGKKEYCATKAHHRAYVRQWRKKRECNKVAMDRVLTRYIEEKLRLWWSPERISGRLKHVDTHLPYVSAKSIRKYIKKRPSLERYLFWERVKKKSGPKPSVYLRDLERTYIDERPPVVGVGHIEGDFIVSSKSTSVLLVLVDMVSYRTWVRKLPHRGNDLVNEVISHTLKGITVQSLTLDNDIAFQRYKDLEERLNTKVYFTRPFCSTDKALVENTNRWVRSFVPKKTDIATVSSETVAMVETWLNETPRQCLCFRSPLEVLSMY